MIDVRNVKLEFKKEKKPKTILKYSILIIIVILGSFGVLFNVTVSPETSYYRFNVWVTIFSAVLVYCVLGILPGKLKYMYLLEVFVFIYLIFVKYKEIWYGITAVTNCLLKSSGEEYHNNILSMIEIDTYVTTALCFFMFFVTSCLCFFILTWHSIFGSVIPVIFLCVPLYFGIEPSWRGFIFTLIYIVAAGILNASSFYQYTGKKGSVFVKYGTFFYPKPRNSFITVITPLLIGTIITTIIMSTSFKTEYKRSEKMNEQYYALTEIWDESGDGSFWSKLKEVSEVLFTSGGKGALSEGISGISHGSRLGTTGSLSQSNVTALEVSFADKPRNSVYLKGYVGSVYKDNAWVDFEEGFYNSTEYNRFNNSFKQKNMFPQTQAIYYLLSYGRKDYIKVNSKLEKNKSSYIPYYFASGADDSQEFYTENDTLITSKNPNDYACTFVEGIFESSTMAMFISEGNFTLPMAEEYYDFVKKNTTLVPDTPDMAKLRREFIEKNNIPSYEEKISEAPRITDEELAWLDSYGIYYGSQYSLNNNQTPYSATMSILDEIKGHLKETAEYSLSPGVTPIDEDFICYFLTEQKKGYCSYFASAGTMLARMCGIPARYVEGYIVKTDEVTELETPVYVPSKDYILEYQSTVMGKNAHAWTEVYIDGLGWMPFEFTPGFSSGETLPTSTDDDNPDPNSGDNNPDVTTTAPPASSPAVTTAPNVSSGIVTSSAADVTSTVTAQTAKKFDWLIFFPIALGIAAVGSAILLRRHIFARRRILATSTEYTNTNITAAYGYILNLLEFIGITRGNLNYFDFADNIDFSTSSFDLKFKFDKEKFKSITALASKAKFSNHVLTEEESQSVISFGNELAKSIYDELKLTDKYRMAYAKGLI
ncbi:MAG: hypothetical protein LBL93_00880 [Ruminococcus sp.]|jgi:hypothetical protein|nr:hypothetical protein [Ruminococcus sp.]